MHVYYKSHQGFTLVELIVVIALLGVLSAVALPRMMNITDEAHRASVAGTGAAFQGGVNLVHSLWRARGAPGAVLNFVSLAGTRSGGDLSVNVNGWPADTRGVSLTLNSTNDCIDVWNAVMIDSAPTVASGATADYQALNFNGNSCRYTYRANPAFTIIFDSNTGSVVINN